MTRKAGEKKRIRARKALDGIEYCSARRRERAGTFHAEFGTVWELDALGLSDLLYGAAESWCSNQMDQPIEEVVGPPDTLRELPAAIDELAIHELEPSKGSLDVHKVDEYEGGTLALTVFLEVLLQIDGYMAKADGYAADDAGRVTILNEDFNEHNCYVLVNQQWTMQLEFSAIATPDFESVEDLQLVTASVLEPQ